MKTDAKHAPGPWTYKATAMDWYDPAARLALIERVGPAEYDRQHAAHKAAAIVETVNGHEIRRVGSRFGGLFAVGNTRNAFSRLEQARAFALTATVAGD